MLTVIMECRDHEPELAQTLAGLVAGAVEGLVSDVVILDHGSTDGSSRVAEAAGCRFYEQWDMQEVVRAARGEWLLVVEPGARPAGSWIDEICEYIALNTAPAQFSPSRNHRLPLLRRLGRKASPLEDGLLLSKRQAMDLVKSGTKLCELPRGLRMRSLSAELVPARVARQTRAGLQQALRG
ncbi:glycosyl transferase [Ciceribacter sp. L1K23]|uniref:glycosyl transferase n=1 Tax=unclassified Ciceribacter TaxID=2628820 RepID=UPI001ABE1815|nr:MULTISPECIES: glycosyl transferase [unclassified Ciceribacter]MBO3759068.1 glycosyl transferase [Ciceribacter sp. L1K22]MBR0556785.1 glycosyl transferase [Ciceribacter sp. L1K23]